MANKNEILKLEKVESAFQKINNGCGKKTGYFESSPYHCGDIVQTTPCDGFESYCRKCMPLVKKAMSEFDSVIVPAIEELRKINDDLRGKGV